MYKHEGKTLTITPAGQRWYQQMIELHGGVGKALETGDLKFDTLHFFTEYYKGSGPVHDYYADSEDITYLAYGTCQRAIDTLVRKGHVTLS